MQLTTERTQLDIIQKKDFAEVIQSLREEGAVKYVKHLQNLSNSKYADFLEKKQTLSENKHLFYWVVREKKTQNYIGTIGITPYLGSDAAFHIGFRISKNYQRKGFATELGNVVIDFVKNTLQHKQIFGLIMEGNIASKNLLLQLGFRFTRSEFNTTYKIQLETYCLEF